MSAAIPVFSPPRSWAIVLARDVWVKGSNLPVNGVCLFREGEEVTAHTDNGADWYLLGHYHGRQIRVATLISSLT